MGKFSESHIRDYLSTHLDKIEPGLILLGVESHLKNPIGTSGRIDILAKDRFGNRVIIEIKRSDQSAREAIHEIHKYVALFRSHHGLSTKRIRCIVVSTEWKELLVPFSEFVKNSIYQIEGIKIILDSLGRITESVKVPPRELNAGISYFLAHSIYLFDSSLTRSARIAEYVAELKKTVAPGFIIIEVDYVGDNQSVIFPRGLYLVFSRLDSETESEWRREYCEEYEYEPEEVEDVWFDDHCIEKIMESLELSYDSFEIGNSEKLHTILQTGWDFSTIHRYGNIQTELAATDDELISRLCGHGGENVLFFARMTRPEFHHDWADIKKEALNSLMGNETWTIGFKYFCEEVEKSYAKSSVSINIYNPLNLPIALFKLASQFDNRYLPSIEFIACDDETNRVFVMNGEIRWEGKKYPTFASAFKCFDEGLWGFIMAQQLNIAWEKDKVLMVAHGLEYILTQYMYDNNNQADPVVLCQKDGALEEHPKPSLLYTMDKFVRNNNGYFLELIQEFNKVSRGL